MAQEHYFDKLKLSTPAVPKRISSTFSTLTLRDIHDERKDAWLYAPDHANSAPTLPTVGSAVINTDQLLLARTLTSEEDLSNKLRNGEDFDSNRSETEVSDVAPSSTASEGTGSMRTRATSISFAREVTLEDGDKQLLEKPLPHSGSAPRPVPVQNGANSQRHLNYAGLQVHGGGIRDPESAQDGIPLDSQEDFATPSYQNGQSQTPTTLDIPQAAASLSPLLSEDSQPRRVSPIWPIRSSNSVRSRSYNRLTNLSTTGEPRSARSATSSMSEPSPANKFLAAFSRRATHSVEEAPEPDDEGQEIGDHSGWIIGRKIGYGGFSVVKEVYTMENDKRVVRAVKILRKQPAQIREEAENERVQAEFEHEVSVWRYLRHRYIVPLLSVYDTPFATFCITKLNQGGTLHDLLRSRRQQYTSTERGLSANLAKRYMYQLAAAIRYLHEDVRVVHRDVKLENCLLDMTAPDSKTEGGNILLCDFGMADFIHNETRNDDAHSQNAPDHRNIGPSETSSRLSLTTSPGATLENRETTLTILGSLEYAAPELIAASTTLYSTSADMWAFGVVVYTVLTGSLPFSHGMKEKLAVMIEKTQWDVSPLYSCPAVRDSGVAGSAVIELVKGCLTHDPGERWDIQRVLGCRWFVGCKAFYGDGTEDDDEAGIASGWK